MDPPRNVLITGAGRGIGRATAVRRAAAGHRVMAVARSEDQAFHFVRLGCADMRTHGWGRVVLIGSTFGLVGAPLEATYDSSKHGLVGLTRSAAHDLGADGITCNVVLPGWVRTEMSKRSVGILARRRCVEEDVVWRELESLNPARRLVTPEEVASVVESLRTCRFQITADRAKARLAGGHEADPVVPVGLQVDAALDACAASARAGGRHEGPPSLLSLRRQGGSCRATTDGCSRVCSHRTGKEPS